MKQDINNGNEFDKTPANHVPLSPISFLKRTAKIFPDKKAVIYEDISYTWSEVALRSQQLSAGLNKRGIKKGDTVSVVAANTPEMIELHFGVPLSGAVLNTINVRLDPETIAYILDHSDAKILIFDTVFFESVNKALIILDNPDLQVINIVDQSIKGNKQKIGQITYEDLLIEGNLELKDEWILPDDEWDTISLNYTSGTSGRPKGVLYHHRGAYLMTLGTAVDWQLPMHTKYLYTVPLFHCNGWGHVWTLTAKAGTIICCRNVTAENIYKAISEHHVTHLAGAPIVLGMILNADEKIKIKLTHPVEIMTAAAPPPAAVLDGIERLGFNVVQVYGLTETYGHTVMCVWQEEWNNKGLEERATLKSRQGVNMIITEDLEVFDRDKNQPVPNDGKSLGEIMIRGNIVMKGYFKNLRATDEVLSGGWFHTGDLAVRHPSGYVEIKDRLKDIIISGGENISSVDVENVMYRHPAVAFVAVVAKPDDKWGEVPCAFIELKQGMVSSEEELLNFGRDNLPGFKRPKKVLIGAIPKTATGKIQKFALRQKIINLRS